MLLIELFSSATRLTGFAMHISQTSPARAKALAIEQPSAPPSTAPERKRKMPSARTRRRSRAQALTEYSTLIAFVSVLIALAFSFTEGKVAPAVSKAFHETAKQTVGRTLHRRLRCILNILASCSRIDTRWKRVERAIL